MKTFQNAIIILLFFASSPLWAQNDTTKKSTPVQLTFLYPIGSNGMNSPQYTNNVSLNMIFGINGSVHGLELAGIGNVLKSNMTGVQLAGITNITAGYVNGIQCAGIYNHTNAKATGAQVGGIANIAMKGVDGLQLGGITNISHHNTTGLQISGIYNWSHGNASGAQVSGIYNRADKKFYGLQLAMINSAKNITGLQVGLINVADSADGVSFGLINVIKNGYHSLEISGNEVLPMGVSIKSGTNTLYNIYYAGIQINHPHVFGLGLGFGTNIQLSSNLSLSMDLTSNYINESKKFEGKMNLLNRVDMTMNYDINKHFTILAGPSFNVHVSQLGYESTGGFTTAIAKNPFYTETFYQTQVQMWIGVKFGARFNF